MTPRISSLEVATPYPLPPAVVHGKRTGATTTGLKAVWLPGAHEATGLQALPTTSVNLMQRPLRPTPLIFENVLRLLLLRNPVLQPTSPIHSIDSRNGNRNDWL